MATEVAGPLKSTLQARAESYVNQQAAFNVLTEIAEELGRVNLDDATWGTAGSLGEAVSDLNEVLIHIRQLNDRHTKAR